MLGQNLSLIHISEPTRPSLILTEVYENQAGIDDHFQQAQNNGANFRDDLSDFETKCENLVKINSSDIIQSMW